MKNTKRIATIPLLIVILLLVTPISAVQAQGRVNIPTAMTPSTASPATSGVSPYGTPSYETIPSSAASGTTYGSTSMPYSGVAPASPYSGISTPYPGVTSSTAPVTSGSVPGPLPAFQNQGALPPAGWDPYASPGTTTNPTLLSPDYYPEVPTLDFEKANQWRQRLIDELRLDYYFLAARGSKRFGTNDLDLSTSIAIPFRYNKDTPFLVTPGFAFHWWEGPISNQLSWTSPMSHLPPRVYDAYLDTAWNPQIPGTNISGELCFRVGIYSDFKKITAESIRYTGHGFGVIKLSSALKAKLGIVYYDRVKVKLLPAGGFVWTPNKDVRLDILFPNPMFSRRMKALGTVDTWLYLRGEYGGGSWFLTPTTPAGMTPEFSPDQYDYNDMRAALGIEFDRDTGLNALIEVGIAFERELVARSTGNEFSPSTTIFLRAGLTR